MGTVTIKTFADATARDAITGWDEGDLAYVLSVGLTVYDGAAWGLTTAPVTADIPEVPAVPLAQDVVDALVTLGLVTQAEA
jgi:hypothetical protein